MNFRMPLPSTKVFADALNPEECPHCKRMWKRKSVADKSEECPECRAYLDKENDDAERVPY